MRSLLLSTFAIACWLDLGCSPVGGNRGGSRVVGKIQHNGAPLANARVVFCEGTTSVSPIGPTAITDESGKYAVVGVKPGDYKVVVYKMVLKKGAIVPDENDLEQIEASGQGSHVLPPKYSRAASTPLLATVQSGSNALDFSIESK